MAAKLLRCSANFLKYSNPYAKKNVNRLLSTKAVTYEQTLLNAPETQITTLKNGVRIATEESGLPTCTVGLWIDAGARYESESTNGAANLVEHLLFKGTAKRSQDQLEKEIESIGAHLNAYTSREHTAIYAKCLSKDVPLVVDILADIVQNNSFADGEVERARTVVMRELEEAETNQPEVVSDLLHSVAYQGTPLSNSIMGPSDNIKQLSSKDLKEYVDDNFKAGRTVLVGAGGVSHKQLTELAEQHLSKQSNAYERAFPMHTVCRFTGSEVRVRDDDMPLLHFALAMEGAGWSNLADHIALQVASTVIGSWDKSHGGGTNLPSILAQACATKHCAHGFKSFNLGYMNTGLWGIYFVGEPMPTDDFLLNLQTEWMRMCTQIPESHVERARNQLRTKVMSELQDTTALANDIGRQVLYNGRYVSRAELDSRIQDVTASVVKDVCMKYIYDRCPALSAVGPIEALPDYSDIRGRMAWLRY